MINAIIKLLNKKLKMLAKDVYTNRYSLPIMQTVINHEINNIGIILIANKMIDDFSVDVKVKDISTVELKLFTSDGEEDDSKTISFGNNKKGFYIKEPKKRKTRKKKNEILK